MTDILERLRQVDSPSGSIMDIVRDAIAEIEYLRSVAGAVSDGLTLADIKARNVRTAELLKDYKGGPLPQDWPVWNNRGDPA